MLATRRHRASEDGVALITALFAVVVLFGLATLLLATATNQQGFTGNERDWEAALHDAEAGIDWAANRVNISVLDGDDATDYITEYDTDVNTWGEDYVPFETADEANEREYVLQTVDELVADDPTVVEVSGYGEYVGFRPMDYRPAEASGNASDAEPMMALYAAGYFPTYDNPREIRVIKIQYDIPGFIPQFALLTAGDVDIGGQAEIYGEAGSVHANGELQGGTSNSCTIENEASDDSGTRTYCGKDTTERDDLRIPPFQARQFHDPLIEGDPGTSNDDARNHRAAESIGWYDLCPDGTVWRVGHDASGNSGVGAGTWVAEDAVDRVAADADGPCDTDADIDGIDYEGRVKVWPVGSPAPREFRGWEFNAGPNEWKSQGNPGVLEGVYYIHHANGNMQHAQGKVTVIVACEEDITADPPRCTSGANDGSNDGNLNVNGAAQLDWAYDSISVLTDRDFTQNGGSSQNPGRFDGAVLIREQFSLSGTAVIEGALLNSDEPDTDGSPVSANDLRGNFEISYDGDLTLPLPGVIRMIAWNELRR